MPPPAECSRCGAGLEGAHRAGTRWSQVWDVKITRFVTEYLLPLLTCPCCRKVNAARLPPWAHPGSVSYGPGINTAVILSFRVSRGFDLRRPVVNSVADGMLAA